MSQQFGKVMQRHIQAAYEQGFREGAHQAIIEERRQRQEKSLRGKLKRRLKRGPVESVLSQERLRAEQ